MDLLNPYAWNLASTPYEDSNPKFPEAEKVNDIAYGKNRALLAWYTVDGIFTRKSSSSALDILRMMIYRIIIRVESVIKRSFRIKSWEPMIIRLCQY